MNAVLDRYIERTIKIARDYPDITASYIKLNHNHMNVDFNKYMQVKIASFFGDRNHKIESELEPTKWTVDELVLLFKGSSIGEVWLKKGFGHGYGSVSITTRLFEEIKRLDLEKAEDLYRWAESFGLLTILCL